MKSRFIVGILFLLIQFLSIIYARFIPERFFCWAPYDEHTYLEVQVYLNNNALSDVEILKRYRYKAKGWEPRSIYNVFNIIEQYERTYGVYDAAEVFVKYSTNGHQEKIWKLLK
ncbi:hypothetical protein JYT89_02085 [Flavobacteriaceae bacterium AH-315-B10]|nr:hypothetical protein [Flavobacteriaceae bacterium AH-315-B10]